jgi:hypothetical protein
MKKFSLIFTIFLCLIFTSTVEINAQSYKSIPEAKVIVSEIVQNAVNAEILFKAQAN